MRLTPSSSSWARIWSARAQSRSLRAWVRSATSSVDGLLLRRGQVGERAAVLQVGGVEAGQAQAEQGVGGGDHGALAVRGERGLAQRVLQGGEDLRGAQVGRDGRVDGVQQALRGRVALGGR